MFEIVKCAYSYTEGTQKELLKGFHELLETLRCNNSKFERRWSVPFAGLLECMLSLLMKFFAESSPFNFSRKLPFRVFPVVHARDKPKNRKMNFKNVERVLRVSQHGESNGDVCSSRNLLNFDGPPINPNPNPNPSWV